MRLEYKLFVSLILFNCQHSCIVLRAHNRFIVLEDGGIATGVPNINRHIVDVLRLFCVVSRSKNELLIARLQYNISFIVALARDRIFSLRLLHHIFLNLLREAYCIGATW